MIGRIVLSILLLASLGSAALAQVAEVFIVNGQSNAMNFSTVNIAPPGGYTPDSQVHIWNDIAGAWETYNPSGAAGANSNGDNANVTYGPELGYVVSRRAARPDVDLWIFKHVVGSCGLAEKGSGICDWSPRSVGANKAWKPMFTAFVRAMNAIRALGYIPDVQLMITVNGETDTLAVVGPTPSIDADRFYYNQAFFAESTRSYSQAHQMRFIMIRPQLPVSMGGNNTRNGPYTPTVRSAIMSLADGRDFRNAWVNIDDLGDDPLSPGHLPPADVITMGVRVYDVDAAMAR